MRFPPHGLLDFGAARFRACGVGEADTRLIADGLVHADVCGHAAHGVTRTEVGGNNA